MEGHTLHSFNDRQKIVEILHMNITIIGSGTCTPSLRRAAPCIMIEAGPSKILCDTGPGTLRQLLKAGLSTDMIDALFYTHFHLDHTGELAPFLFASKYADDGPRTRSLTIAGPAGLTKFYDNLKNAYGSWVIPEQFTVNWVELSGDTAACSGLSVKAASVLHADPCIALRFDAPDGTSVVYSGDTDYCNSLVDLARGADVLILECSFPEHMKKSGHLIPSLAGRIARESACKKLVITHLQPPCDRHDLLTPLRREYGGEVVIAEDLMAFSVGQ